MLQNLLLALKCYLVSKSLRIKMYKNYNCTRHLYGVELDLCDIVKNLD
jgi:hypothetical protein